MSHIEQIPPELTWHIRRQVLYPDQEFGKAILDNDDDGMHLGLFYENKLISVVSLFRKENEMQLRKFATVEEYQGKGFGTQLLKYLIEIAKTENCKRIWCNARKNASGFYIKFGFTETEKTYYKDGHDFVIMEKILF
ncbi:MAG: GNAT family N-acetyltransferase [Daejeonella sp.]|uniref:GNAT family N-acetyltransferase n=1 Tax=Daejeonella sp. TaxID=2805397 RepID=UPI002736EEC8|nr:GNAT family N-acetyltransferase [Daejeonella sp.]MDP3467856.1 GNAT family N-acetyltransferase [Daejeonella sp.]